MSSRDSAEEQARIAREQSENMMEALDRILRREILGPFQDLGEAMREFGNTAGNAMSDWAALPMAPAEEEEVPLGAYTDSNYMEATAFEHTPEVEPFDFQSWNRNELRGDILYANGVPIGFVDDLGIARVGRENSYDKVDRALREFQDSYESGLVIFTTPDNEIAEVVVAEKIAMSYEVVEIPLFTYAVQPIVEQTQYRLSVMFETRTPLDRDLIRICHPTWFVIKTEKSNTVLQLFFPTAAARHLDYAAEEFEYEVTASDGPRGAGNLLVEPPGKFMFPLHWLPTLDFGEEEVRTDVGGDELSAIFRAAI